MKKTFINPMLTISVFNTEAVVTNSAVSGISDTLINAGVDEQYIKNFSAKEVDWTF